MMEKELLIQSIKKILFTFDEIEFAYLFGSFALNLETPLSDIDIAVYQKTEKSAYNYRMMEFKIESELIQSIHGYEFDVRSFNDAPIIVVGKILDEGNLLFHKDEDFYYNYVEINRLKYMDYCIVYNPLFNERYKNLLNDR